MTKLFFELGRYFIIYEVHECDEHMNGESLMMLKLMNEFVMMYDINLNDHNIYALINDIVCE